MLAKLEFMVAQVEEELVGIHMLLGGPLLFALAYLLVGA